MPLRSVARAPQSWMAISQISKQASVVKTLAALADCPDNPGGVGSADMEILDEAAPMPQRNNVDRLTVTSPDIVVIDPGAHHPYQRLTGTNWRHIHDLGLHRRFRRPVPRRAHHRRVHLTREKPKLRRIAQLRKQYNYTSNARVSIAR